MNEIPTLDRRGLRRFGLLTGLIIAVLFGLVLPKIKGAPLPAWPWITGGIFWTWAVIAPASIDPLYRVWMKIGLVLGWINTRIILGFIFFIVVTPIGLLRRTLYRQKIDQGFDPGLKSYRSESKIEALKKMEDPF